MDNSKRLRPGRHQLSRDEVQTHQRERIFAALEVEMSVKGYGETSVGDIVKSAGVSRQTFYELFDSKRECFIASYERRQGAVIDQIFTTSTTDAPLVRFAALLKAYLEVMSHRPDISLLYLSGIAAAGPKAAAIRVEKQQQFVDGLAALFDAHTDRDLFACRTLVAAISALVINALVDADPQAVQNLHAPLVDVAARLLNVE
ncbi:TetR/AcrR family transcriptional regulator [Mycolicibacterium sp. P1-18]|uniref:TetR/AcrR family transcriptional regulator n=1 Tax=Mycolicibacterium sp. P1-18 TaxID=2024615 RepID=UPI0011F28217|nr:TetR/AcrR family transcriptional regulator [Mycolicibacterium sp. P1-18]KAA0092741.1 TetR/AcrR family transcriptional regulator [Mycolicibacterium sp. P1-18]